MRKYNWLLILLLPAMVSCHEFMGKRIRGNGNTKTEERTVSSFKNVEVSGAFNVFVSQGALAPVKIEGDENLLGYIEVLQEGDRIIVRTRHGFNLSPSAEINIYVTAPVYSDIDVSGACNITGQTKINNSEDLALHVSGAGNIKMEVDAPSLKAEVSGSGAIDLKGQTKDVDLEITGAGHAHCFDLLSENTKVDITGAGDAEVYASVKLDADLTGAGSVKYKGNASNVNQHVGGAGSVRKVE